MPQRILIAGFKHETNTFSPIPTPLESFGRGGGADGPVGGQDAIAAYRDAIKLLVDLLFDNP